MSAIKFICKTEYYQSKQEDKGLFKNAYVVPVMDITHLKNKLTRIGFELCCKDENEVETIISTDSLHFNEVNIDTIVNVGTVEEPIEKEIVQAVTDGWTYDKGKVISWGYPDYLRVLGYYTITDGVYQFPEGVFGQIALDFILQAVKIEGLALQDNFEIEIETPQ